MLGFLTLLLIAVVVVGVTSWNSLKGLSHSVRAKTSNVQIAVSKKLTLLNQLMDVVKNYQESEQFMHLKIAQDINAVNLAASYQQSGAVLSSIQGVAERYPNLKASDQYQQLMLNITHCEVDIQHHREQYTAAAEAYNRKRSAIPTIFIAPLLGFSEAPYLRFDVVGNDATSLNEFKTGDGERLKHLLRDAGTTISGVAQNISSHTAQAAKAIHGRVSSKAVSLYYLGPDGIPKGPKTLEEIRQLINDGVLQTDVKVCTAGSDNWSTMAEFESR